MFVNHKDPPPTMLPRIESGYEDLQYLKANVWIGKIQEIRLERCHKVFFRVFWLYWPEELPGGREPYHGQWELILSNHADIVELSTVSDVADVLTWDELDERCGLISNTPFWRQTYNLLQRHSLRKKGLSFVRRHCHCLKEYNPDKNMIQLPGDERWYHEECVTN